MDKNDTDLKVKEWTQHQEVANLWVKNDTKGVESIEDG